MQKKTINIVWLKRDLRTKDHAPLFYAEKAGLPYIILFLFEPTLYQHQDTSLRHLQFQYRSILTMNQTLNVFQKTVVVCHGNADEIFAYWSNQYHIHTVFSYRESGIDLTYQRDKVLKKQFNQHQILWQEFQRDGILRGIKDRTDWDKQWYAFMHQPLFENSFSIHTALDTKHPFNLPVSFEEKLNDNFPSFQPPGEHYAKRYLDSFLNERGADYSKFISKPWNSRKSCSRLSPYISWGNLSIRQVYQSTLLHKKSITNKMPFANFLSRLKWHCHFIQKFEVECRYEFECINRGYEDMPWENNAQKLDAWKSGQTGIPIIDASTQILQLNNFMSRCLIFVFYES
jgi:deoxyribodipyrimidine photo-lyase